MEESLLGIKCWEIEVPPACDRADLLERNLVQIEFENGNRLLPKRGRFARVYVDIIKIEFDME
ncbi:hypothetical protein NC653_015162 [Populus alba x Populus x berolinensis]|uniref:Uncharacterized protein n=1 Tax=Populus alba x Populus x berolinensis TaxID=444605 RepID=A0AAD6VXX1_9ROSI|nr:hypothetical protein NC653_015162 [Populus alba x Populus x berolinensis]